MFNIIFNMYSHIKSRVVYNNETSTFFQCENGVRQGENMSAFLLSMYLNDLHDFLNESDVQGLPTITDMFENELDIFFSNNLLYYMLTTLYC